MLSQRKRRAEIPRRQLQLGKVRIKNSKQKEGRAVQSTGSDAACGCSPDNKNHAMGLDASTRGPGNALMDWMVILDGLEDGVNQSFHR